MEKRVEIYILPPELVEALAAYKMGYWKVDDMRLGFDCFDPNAPKVVIVLR